MKHTRKQFFTSLVGLAIAAAGSTAWAQTATWPNKPIRLVVTFPAGGSSDAAARIVAPTLAERLGQAVTVDNKPGAGGGLGLDLVAKSPADGYTIVLASAGGLTANPSLYPNLSYSPSRDFAPITLFGTSPFVLVANPALPANTAKELLTLAKTQVGKLSYASGGNGTAMHLAGELLKSMTDSDILHVPYRGSAPAAFDLIAGQVQLAMNNIVPTLPHVKSGRLRALGVSGPLRSPVLPEVPTVAEAGLPGYEAVQWYGVLLPAKVPRPIAALLHKEITAVLQIPIVRTRLTEEGGDVVGGTPEQFAAYIALETEKWAKVVKAAGVKAE